jgi:hypothetical protein
MADLKISQLTGATTPLAGTEVLPIVQSSATKKVSVGDLTAGRSISVSGLTNTGVTASSVAFFSAGQLLSGNATLTYNSGTQQLGFQNAAASAYAYLGTTGAGSNADLSVYMGATEAVRFTNAGSVAIKVAGQGIDFSATGQAAGMTSELLDDYEEGTWTPTDSSGGGLTFTGVIGRYVKVGKVVNVWCKFTYPTNSDSAHYARVGGLPFTSDSALGGGLVSVQSSNGTRYLLEVSASETASYPTVGPYGQLFLNADLSEVGMTFMGSYQAS